jgi:hypothetical protein
MPAANRTDTAARPLTQRSRATNGKTLFADGGDMRSPWTRRMRDIFGLHLSDLGGADAASEGERSIARRAAVTLPPNVGQNVGTIHVKQILLYTSMANGGLRRVGFLAPAELVAGATNSGGRRPKPSARKRRAAGQCECAPATPADLDNLDTRARGPSCRKNRKQQIDYCARTRVSRNSNFLIILTITPTPPHLPFDAENSSTPQCELSAALRQQLAA